MQLRGTQIVVDTVSAKAPVISGSGATRSLNELESGSTVLLDRAAGTVFTLPTAAPGIYFDFVANLAASSASIVSNVSAGTQLMTGDIRIATDTHGGTGISALTTYIPNPTLTQRIYLNGTTTGGVSGSRIRVAALSTSTWYVSGLVVGTGSLITPFYIA